MVKRVLMALLCIISFGFSSSAETSTETSDTVEEFYICNSCHSVVSKYENGSGYYSAAESENNLDSPVSYTYNFRRSTTKLYIFHRAMKLCDLLIN